MTTVEDQRLQAFSKICWSVTLYFDKLEERKMSEKAMETISNMMEAFSVMSPEMIN